MRCNGRLLRIIGTIGITGIASLVLWPGAEPARTQSRAQDRVQSRAQPAGPPPGRQAASAKAKAEKPAGPARKMKIVTFVTLQTQGIVKLKFLDAKGNPTKAPKGGTLRYRTNITKPRKGSLSMAKKAKWKPEDKLYVITGIAPRQKIVCPPRVYWIKLWFKKGRKRFYAFFRKKLNCI